MRGDCLMMIILAAVVVVIGLYLVTGESQV